MIEESDLKLELENAYLSGIPGTSLWGLKARSDEHFRADALFQDALAVKWFERLEPFWGGHIAQWYQPVLQQAIAIRTDIFDRAVRQHIQAHAEPVIVELGAGFSTRFDRLQATCPWYELDLPEVIELRMAMGESQASNHWYLAESIFADSWRDHLKDYDPKQIFLIAEGLLMYFPLARVEALFERLHQDLAGAWIAFDMMGSANYKAAQEPGKEVDAPIYWGMKSHQAAYAHFGLEAAGDLSLPAQIRQFGHYGRRLKPITRWLLSQKWLTQRQGGTLLARIPNSH